MKTNISVILPIHNSCDEFSFCLKSLMAQTFKEFEIICVNSASDNSSLEVLEKFSKKDERIKIINKINEGVGSACNAGINASFGEYLLIAEYGDFYNKRMLENLYKLAKKSEAEIVKSPYFKFDKYTKMPDAELKNEICSGVCWDKRCKMPNWFFRINECPSFLSFHPAVFATLYKKSFLNNNSIRFVEAMGQDGFCHSFVDFPFYVETMLLARKIVYTNNPYSYHKKCVIDFQNSKNYIFPFDRIEEVLEILPAQKIKDKNIIANVYKRILKLLYLVFENLDEEKQYNIKTMPYEVQLRIEKVISLMDEDIVNNSLFIDDFERRFFNILSPNCAI